MAITFACSATPAVAAAAVLVVLVYVSCKHSYSQRFMSTPGPMSTWITALRSSGSSINEGRFACAMLEGPLLGSESLASGVLTAILEPHSPMCNLQEHTSAVNTELTALAQEKNGGAS